MRYSICMATFITLLLIFSGETLSIAAEFVASKKQLPLVGHAIRAYAGPVGLVTLGGVLLIAGYAIGFHHLRNIWIISAVSIGSILIVEPTFALLMFNQLPSRGAAIGFVLGVAGLIIALID